LNRAVLAAALLATLTLAGSTTLTGTGRDQSVRLASEVLPDQGARA